MIFKPFALECHFRSRAHIALLNPVTIIFSARVKDYIALTFGGIYIRKKSESLYVYVYTISRILRAHAQISHIATCVHAFVDESAEAIVSPLLYVCVCVCVQDLMSAVYRDSLLCLVNDSPDSTKTYPKRDFSLYT